jgi:hypothetical protein
VGMVDSPHELFIGRGAENVGAPRHDAEEVARVEWIPLAEIPGLIERDELLGAGTLVALLYILAVRRTSGDAPPAV